MDFAQDETINLFDDDTMTLQKNDYLAFSMQNSAVDQKVPTSLWDEGLNINFSNRLDNPLAGPLTPPQQPW